jgi:hypothetical protein
MDTSIGVSGPRRPEMAVTLPIIGLIFCGI